MLACSRWSLWKEAIVVKGPQGGFTWGLKCQVPFMSTSPNMDAKSQPLSLKNLFKAWFISIKVRSWLFYANFLWDFLLRVESSFLLDPTLNTSSDPHLQRVLPCRHYCHYLGLGTWDLVWSGKSQLPSSQWLRLQELTSSELGVKTCDPCEPALIVVMSVLQ